MQDEPDTCRICSAPAEPDAPLFHPCKCSGTIRYIHQDCLTTWLAHSKKKTCDVCKYQYTFTKVYADNMPNHIPFILFFRKFAQKTFWTCLMAVRGLMVATIWLAFLPYVTVWTWRFYFIMGENIAWWIYDHPRPNPMPVFHSYFTNLTLADEQTNNNRTNPSETTVMALVTSYPVWRALSADIFTGQIIASLIVLVFLGVFLLREWIIQNARPGVFEDEDIIDAGEPDGAEVPAGPDPAPIEEALLAPPVETAEAVEIPEDHDDAADQLTGSEVEQEMHNDTASHSGRKRRLSSVEDADGMEVDGLRATRPRPPHIDKAASAEDRNPPLSRGTSVEAADDTFSSDDSARNSIEFKFTFAVEVPSSVSRQSSTSQSFSFNQPPDGSDFVQYEASSSLPFPLTVNTTASDVVESAGVRRPPLPNGDQLDSQPSSFSEERGEVAPFFNTCVNPNVSDTNEQLLTSSLATYHAPEQIEADVAGGSVFLDDDDPHKSEKGSTASSANATVAESAFREDLDEYFRDPDANEDERHALHRMDGFMNNDMLPEGLDRHAIDEEQEPIDPAEDQDVINDDDVDGALEEAIGMRGPLTSVFQNAALMIFVLDTTIGLAVWLPFTIGKTTALLSLEPLRTAQLLQWPVRIIRYGTDPVVDLLALVLFKSLHSIRNTASLVLPIDPKIDLDIESRPRSYKTVLGMFSLQAFTDGNSEDQHSAIVRGISHVANSPVAQFLEPYFARLGRKVRLKTVALKAGWVELANGDASVNRFFAITLGYLLCGLVLAIYLNVLNVGSVQSAGRAIRNAIRQQLIVLKVVTFLVIELALFPLGCGIMLDICTLQLFPGASVQSRLSFFSYAPVTTTFYHWMVGTMFMYQFAVLLGGCRKIMRPGALWFIKDPQDQNFHPVRDILDRPTFVQMKKLAISAMMYSFVVALGMGGLVVCLYFWGKLLLPLRWKLREPLSDIPIDLLFLHIAMPSTLKYFRPRKIVLAVATKYWKWAARQLRLTSYMFGSLHAEEMRPSQSIFSWLSSTIGRRETPATQEDSDTSTLNGSFRRVPAQDNISLPREIRATVAVDINGNPLDEAGRRLMDLQNAEAVQAKRQIEGDYKVVYLPPHFRERLVVFIASLWIAGSFLFVAGFAVPALLGRAVFRLVLSRDVHDGYSAVLGFYLLWVCYYFGRLLDRMDKRRQRYANDEPRGEYAVYVFKRAMVWIGNVVWVTFWFGVVIPTLLALVIEVYLVHPLRVIINPDLTLKIRIFDSWAIGLVYTKMALSTMRLRPETRIDTALKEMKENGWRRLNVVAVTLEIIAPVTAGLLGMLLLPVLLVLGLQWVLSTKIGSNSLFLYVHPGIFMLAALTRMYSALQSLCASWTQQIRDSEFLVEMRLRNLGPPPSNAYPDVTLPSAMEMETIEQN